MAQAGIDFEIIVVDDSSTDRTQEIARSFDGVRVISAGPLLENWTGKNNALRAGAAEATGKWLLFTDADTEHLSDSLKRAVEEATTMNAHLLSYSPQQVVETFAEHVVMPMIFAELAAQYPPALVRDPESGIAAANGQYMLVQHEAYRQVGGHASVASEILEDVELARKFREGGWKVYFRYGGDAVRTRMYRNWDQLRDGWTKNLALLFPHTVWRAAWLTAWWLLALGTLPIPVLAWLLFRRVQRAQFRWQDTLISTALGTPVFAYLLLRSWRSHRRGVVAWKDRVYARPFKETFADYRKLRTEN